MEDVSVRRLQAQGCCGSGPFGRITSCAFLSNNPGEVVMDLERYLAELKTDVDRALESLLPGEGDFPETIHRAMRYSIFAGGKRVRPILVIAAGDSIGGSRETLLHVGAAFEMMHTYSLIHDDLPALDNDDLRRGLPTCHKVFGDAMAILAGDALLTRCYQVLAETPGSSDSVRLALIREIAYATGTVEGMIGGQVVDIESEGKTVTAPVLDYIHRSKTGALLTSSTRCGALAAGASPEQLEALTVYGRRIGLAFQVIDDILDRTSTREELGKTPGKDQKSQKATYPALYGIEASRKKAQDLILEALASIESLDERAAPLRALAHFVCTRNA
jgi:geranylgeranyl diphosphate synthase type II